jgi:hypothetical protein
MNERYKVPTSRTEGGTAFVGREPQDISTYTAGDCCRVMPLQNKNADPVVYSLFSHEMRVLGTPKCSMHKTEQNGDVSD